MKQQFRALHLKISLIAIYAYCAALPHDSHAVVYEHAYCTFTGSVYDASVDCPGLGSSSYFSLGETVKCGCGDAYQGNRTYRCDKVLAGGYEEYNKYEGNWTEISSTCEAKCTAGTTRTCTTKTISTGTQTCNSNREWAKCVPDACKSGYVVVSTSTGSDCYATCTISNGAGYLYQDTSAIEPEQSSSSSSQA